MKIPVVLSALALLLGIVTSAHALPFDQSFSVPFDASDVFKYKPNKFELKAYLDSDDPAYVDSMPSYWIIEVKFKKGALKSSKIEAGTVDEKGKMKERKIKGSFGDFQIVPDTDRLRYDFHGVFEEENLQEGHLFPHNPWHIYGFFESDGKKWYGNLKGVLSNVDPHSEVKPGVPVPEPATLFLVGVGLIGAAGLRRKLS